MGAPCLSILRSEQPALRLYPLKLLHPLLSWKSSAEGGAGPADDVALQCVVTSNPQTPVRVMRTRTWKQWVGDKAVAISFNRIDMASLPWVALVWISVSLGLFAFMLYHTFAKVRHDIKAIKCSDILSSMLIVLEIITITLRSAVVLQITILSLLTIPPPPFIPAMLHLILHRML